MTVQYGFNKLERKSMDTKVFSYYNLLQKLFSIGKNKPVCRIYFDCIQQACDVVDNYLLSEDEKINKLQKIRTFFQNYKKENAQNDFVKLGYLFNQENLIPSLFTEVLDAFEAGLKKGKNFYLG